MSKITILGGGNMGSLLSVKFSQNNDVCLFLNSPYEKIEFYKNNMRVFNEDTNTYVYGKIRCITDNLEEAINFGEWIFVTFPSFLFEEFSKKIVPLLHHGQHLVGVPGSGGFELFFKNALDKGCSITGLQRVHSVARIITKGEEVRESGVRKNIRCASIPNSFNKEASNFLSEVYSIPTISLDNYLNVTLVNSNPILHTSRLFSIFKDVIQKKEYDKLPLFYEEWDLESSILLEKMDEELFSMINVLNRNGLVVNSISTLLEHYESKNADEMTKKLNSINSLKGLKTPYLINANGKMEPDYNSRYFTADFPLGLDILLSFSHVLNIPCLNMKMVSDWYHSVTTSFKIFSLSDFKIMNIEDLIKFYKD